MQKGNLPPIIKKVGFDFHWDEKKVWALDIPVEEIPVSSLEWHFDVPFWNTKTGHYDLSPNQVLKSPRKYSSEYKRVVGANISYPIDIMRNKGRWLILDGLHRLVRLNVDRLRR